MFQPTTRVSVFPDYPDYRDDAGYPADMPLENPVAEHAPATIVEQSQRTWLAIEARSDKIEHAIGRVSPDLAGIAEYTRLLDEHTGEVYLITTVTRPRLSAARTDVRLTLQRVGA